MFAFILQPGNNVGETSLHKQLILNINHIGDKQFIADYSGISE